MVVVDGQASNQLPWPAEWPFRGPRWLVLVGFLGLLAVAFPVIGILAVAAGSYGSGVFLLLVSPLMIAVTVFGVLTRLGLRRRGVEAIDSRYVDDIEERAVVVPYSRAVAATVWAVLAAMLLFWGLLALLSGLSGVAVSGFGDLAVFAFFLFSALATLYGLALVGEILRGRFARGSVALSPTGVYHRSWIFTSFFPWQSLAMIAAEDLDGPLISGPVVLDSDLSFQRTSRLWKQAEFRLAPHLAIQAKYLSVDPTLAYHALRYYHEHPEARVELGTSAGADRLRRADLLDEQPDSAEPA